MAKTIFEHWSTRSITSSRGFTPSAALISVSATPLRVYCDRRRNDHAFSEGRFKDRVPPLPAVMFPYKLRSAAVTAIHAYRSGTRVPYAAHEPLHSALPSLRRFDRQKAVHPAGVLSTLDKPNTDVRHDVIRQHSTQQAPWSRRENLLA